MPMLRSPEDDLADNRELSYAGAIGFSVWDEKVCSISSQPLFVVRNVKAYRYEYCAEFEKAEELYLENIAEGNSISHCYERLAIMYRKQKRYDDEISIIEKHLKLDEADKSKLSERLIKAKLLKQGIRKVRTKEDRIEAAKKKIVEIKAYHTDILRGYRDSGVVRGVEILIANDNRTCAECKKLSGKKFQLKKAPILPCEKCSSDSCRCTYLAVTKEES